MYNFDGKLYNRTAANYWWSAVRSEAAKANGLVICINNVYPQHSTDRGMGFAQRCALSPTTNTDNVSTKANQLANFPLNFLRTGYYQYSNGGVENRTISGSWWLENQSNTTNAGRLHTNITYVFPQDDYARGRGFALRCSF